MGKNVFSFRLCFCFVFTLDKSRDGSYLGKILEGFTLAQKDAEEKTVRILNSFLRTRHVFVLSVGLTRPSVCSLTKGKELHSVPVRLKPVVVQCTQTNKESAEAEHSRSLYL